MTQADTAKKTAATVSEDVLEAGIQIVNTAKDSAGKWITRIEDKAGDLREQVTERAGELRERVQEKLAELPAIETLPEAIEGEVGRRGRQLTEGAEEWRSRVRAGGLDLWAEVLKQLKGVGKKVEGGLEPLVHRVGLASRGDVKRLENKLARLSKKISALEKGR